MGKKVSVIKIIEENDDLNIILEELQKKLNYNISMDNSKQLIRLLFKLLDTEVTDYVKTQDENDFSNALKIIALLDKTVASSTFSENDAHLYYYKQARLIIKLTGLIGEFLNEEMEDNLNEIKERLNLLNFKNEKEISKKFNSQISDLEKVLEGKRVLKICETEKQLEQEKQNIENGKMFMKLLEKCFECIETESDDIYYYLHLLNVLKSQIEVPDIDPVYFEQLKSLKKSNKSTRYKIILSEIEYIMKNKHKVNSPSDTMAKYQIETDLACSDISSAQSIQILTYKQVSPITFTIDSDSLETIKDDALSIKREKDGYTLGVHITNVGNFILPNSPLDKTIYKRFRSLYLPGQAIHLIPKEMSKAYLSLEAKMPRNVLSLYAKISKNGEVQSYTFSNETTSITHNLSYNLSDRILRRETTASEEIDYNLKLLEHITSLLENAQRSDYRNIKDLFREISTETPTLSEKIVSESMILYNSSLAEYLSRFDGLPVIYRVHEKPTASSIESIIKNHSNPSEDLITLLKEIYPKANYSLENVGHYGLKLPAYSHSSSPIRRYVDIHMQRLYSLSSKGLTVQELETLQKETEALVEYANKREKELKLFQDEYAHAYIKTFKPNNRN